MDTSKIEAMLQQLAEMIHSIDKDIAELKASSAALTAVAASRINPDDPSSGVEQIHELERVAREADPTSERRRQLDDVIEAVKLIRKHGSHET